MSAVTQSKIAVLPQGLVRNHPGFEQLESDYMQESA